MWIEGYQRSLKPLSWEDYHHPFVLLPPFRFLQLTKIPLYLREVISMSSHHMSIILSQRGTSLLDFQYYFTALPSSATRSCKVRSIFLISKVAI